MITKNSTYKRPRREDVARLAGVSVATVSYVLNHSPKPVAEETRSKVLSAVKQLGYQPHGLARSLKTGSTLTIGLVIPVIASPGLAYMASKVQDELARKGYQAVMANSHEDPGMEELLLDKLVSQPVDGMIVSPASVHEARRFERIQEMGIPLVFMDRYVNGVEADRVATESRGAARTAAGYLLDQGCRNTLCLSYSHVASSAIERVEGYREALAARGADHQAQVLVIRDPEGETAEQALLEHFDRSGIPDGILCTTQELGIQLVRAFRHRGLPLPENKVVIFDADWGEVLNPPIPVIKQNLLQIALTSVRLMLERLQGSTDDPQTILYPAELIRY